MTYYTRQISTMVPNSAGRSSDLNDELDAIEAAFLAVEGDIGTLYSDMTDTAYTITLADLGSVIACNNASTQVVTFPADAVLAAPSGSIVRLIQLGAGTVSLDGATINAESGMTKETDAQYHMIEVIKMSNDTWVAVGMNGGGGP